MKRLWRYFWIVLIVYFLLCFTVEHFRNGHNINYTIIQKQDQIIVSENYNKSPNYNGYKIKLNIKEENFEFQILNKYDGNKKIVDNVKYVSDKKYKCVLPIFKNDEILMDILCKDKKGIYYDYSTISDKSDKLRKFTNEMIKYGYDKSNYIDNKTKISKYGLVKLYTNNIYDDMVFGLTNYRGISILANDKLENIKLFENDIYERKFSTFVGKYYLVANYNQEYDFDKIFLVDFKNGNKKTVTLKNPIPNDSYIAGVVGDDIYFVDKSNKKQYVLSIDDFQVKEVGNEQRDMIFYKNGKFETVPYTRLTLKNTYFEDKVKEIDGKYTLFLITGDKDNGYNYYYEEVDGNYYIYRSFKGSTNKKYIFKTSSINNISANGNYVLYQIKNEIKYYSDQTGSRTLLLDSELEFNNNIIYRMYEK